MARSVVLPAWRGGVFYGAGSGVGLTVADLAPPSPEVGPPVTARPPRGVVVPVYARTAAGKGAELRRVQRLEGGPAASEVQLVAGSAADRPASLDRLPGEPGAACEGETAAGA